MTLSKWHEKRCVSAAVESLGSAGPVYSLVLG